MKRLALKLGGGAVSLAALVAPAAADNVTTGLIQEIYVHDCCGRGPYVALILDRPLTNPPPCSQWNVVAATSSASPLAKYLVAAALQAKAMGTQVTVYSRGTCDTTGAFDEWIGIRLQ